jgi:hypothetical protein
VDGRRSNDVVLAFSVFSMSRSHNPSPHFTFVIIVIVTKRVCSPSVPQSVFGVALQEENIPACV